MTIDVAQSIMGAAGSGINNGTATVYCDKFCQTKELPPKINKPLSFSEMENLYTDRFVVPSGAPAY